MAVNVMSIELQGENPTYFVNPFQIEIAFEAIQELPSDLEWRFTYVGSAENDKYDQVLDSITVGPISVGINKFVVETDAPDSNKIPPQDLIGVTCLLVTGHYCNQEFIRVGYFVNNDYDTEELRLNPPSNPDIHHIIREVLVNKPRVTKYPIDWTKISPEQPNMYIPPIFTGSNSNSAMDIEDGAHYGTNGHSVGDKRGFEEDVISFAPEAPQFDFSLLGPLRNFSEILKPELSKRIFQFLDVYELGKSRRVCREWKHIIDSGINWRSIVLDEWDETDNETMLRFLIQQSSPELEELIVLDCPVINDDILNQWLRKCGKELKTIDLDWCVNITTNGIATVLENCNNIQALHLSHINNDRPHANAEEVISHITAKYRGRLFDFGMTYLNSQAVNLLVSNCGPNLTELYINHATIDDNTLTHLVKTCSNLEVLSIAFCNNITPSLVSSIRQNFAGIKTLQATHSPQDFVIDIQAPENEEAASLNVVLKLKTGQEISLAQYKELSQYLKFFPRRIMENVVDNCLIAAGPLSEVVKEFEQLGFEYEVVDEESEEEEEEDDNDMDDIEIDVEEPQSGRKRQKTG